jgi:secondary thiamine-phosphate synthase enzyme
VTHQATLVIATRGIGFTDVTRQIAEIVARSKIEIGLCNVFVKHTSASLVIQENADPAVLRDLTRALEKLAPESGTYEHDDEGPDDMPAHIKSMVTKASETIPITGGQLALGTWQAIYLIEHRRAPHQRTLVVTVLG